MADVVQLKHTASKEWFRYQFLEKKLNTRFGYIFLFILGIGLVYGIKELGIITSPIVIAVFSGLLLCISTLKYPYVGFYFLIAFSSITITIDRLIDPPLPSGTLVEIITYFILLVLLLKHDLKKNIDIKFWTHPVTIGFYILFAYYLMEFFNPEMISTVGWFSFFRKQFSYFIFYCICYGLLDSRAKIIYF